MTDNKVGGKEVRSYQHMTLAATLLVVLTGTTADAADQHEANLSVQVEVVEVCGADLGNMTGEVALQGNCQPAVMSSLEPAPTLLGASAEAALPTVSLSTPTEEMVRYLTLTY